MVSLMIRADGVDRAGLANQMRRLGRPAAAPSARDEKPRGFAARVLSVGCGACAP
jgi:hypothetical protein